LDHDGVPWNNNNAENAIRAFAELRRVIGGTCTEKGLREYLVLLSVCETCKRRGINFLDFMLSGQTNIEESATGRSSQIKTVRENERQRKKPQRRLSRRGSIGHKFDSRAPRGVTVERREGCHLAQVGKKREARSRHKHLPSDGRQLEVVRVINDRCKVRTYAVFDQSRSCCRTQDGTGRDLAVRDLARRRMARDAEDLDRRRGSANRLGAPAGQSP
jgi:hypothetical protein